MKRYLSRIALAAALSLLPTAALRAQVPGQPGAATPPARVAFAFPSLGGAGDVEKITTVLKQVSGVTSVTSLTPQNRLAVVTYVPAQVSVQQIAQAIADTPGAAGRPYQASMVIHVTDLSDAATQEKAITALRKVPGVAGAAALDAAAGTLGIQFAPMTAAEKGGGLAGASQAQLLKALADAGLTASAEPTPAAPSGR